MSSMFSTEFFKTVKELQRKIYSKIDKRQIPSISIRDVLLTDETRIDESNLFRSVPFFEWVDRCTDTLDSHELATFTIEDEKCEALLKSSFVKKTISRQTLLLWTQSVSAALATNQHQLCRFVKDVCAFTEQFKLKGKGKQKKPVTLEFPAYDGVYTVITFAHVVGSILVSAKSIQNFTLYYLCFSPNIIWFVFNVLRNDGTCFTRGFEIIKNNVNSSGGLNITTDTMGQFLNAYRNGNLLKKIREHFGSNFMHPKTGFHFERPASYAVDGSFYKEKEKKTKTKKKTTKKKIEADNTEVPNVEEKEELKIDIMSIALPVPPDILLQTEEDETILNYGSRISFILDSKISQDDTVVNSPVNTLLTETAWAINGKTGGIFQGKDCALVDWIDICGFHFWPLTLYSPDGEPETWCKARKVSFIKTAAYHFGVDNEKVCDLIGEEEWWPSLPFIDTRLYVAEQKTVENSSKVSVPLHLALSDREFTLLSDFTIEAPHAIFRDRGAFLLLLCIRRYNACFLTFLCHLFKLDKYREIAIRYNPLLSNPSFEWLQLQSRNDKLHTKSETREAVLFNALMPHITEGVEMINKVIASTD